MVYTVYTQLLFGNDEVLVINKFRTKIHQIYFCIYYFGIHLKLVIFRNICETNINMLIKTDSNRFLMR